MGTIANNLWFGGTGSVAFDAQAVSGDPKFANAAARDLHLQASSAAVDTGTGATFSLVVDDHDAVVARPVGADIDIGAYEYLAGFVYDRIFADDFQ